MLAEFHTFRDTLVYPGRLRVTVAGNVDVLSRPLGQLSHLLPTQYNEVSASVWMVY